MTATMINNIASDIIFTIIVVIITIVTVLIVFDKIIKPNTKSKDKY